jgi:hypothetical protein
VRVNFVFCTAAERLWVTIDDDKCHSERRSEESFLKLRVCCDSNDEALLEIGVLTQWFATRLDRQPPPPDHSPGQHDPESGIFVGAYGIRPRLGAGWNLIVSGSKGGMTVKYE